MISGCYDKKYFAENNYEFRIDKHTIYSAEEEMADIERSLQEQGYTSTGGDVGTNLE